MRAKSTFFAEGCRGSLSQILMKKYNLRKDCENQTYGLGIKEVWEVNFKYYYSICIYFKKRIVIIIFNKDIRKSA